LLFHEISRRPYAPLGDVAVDVDRLVMGIYHLAHSLDTFVSNEQIKQYLLSLLDAHNANVPPIETLDDFTKALVPISKIGPAWDMPRDESAMLNDVYLVVTSSRGQLRDSLKFVSAAHRRIAITTAGSRDTDWSFVEVVRDSFADHLYSLEERAGVVDDLHHACEIAASTALKKRPGGKPDGKPDGKSSSKEKQR
jgi:hypothetical protein